MAEVVRVGGVRRRHFVDRDENEFNQTLIYLCNEFANHCTFSACVAGNNGTHVTALIAVTRRIKCLPGEAKLNTLTYVT